MASNPNIDKQNANIFELKAFIEHQIQKKMAKIATIR